MDLVIQSKCKLPSKRKQIVKVRKIRQNSWTVTQQMIYVEFLKQNWHFMGYTAFRKANKVFRRIADAVKTRTSAQVKSHHQKLLIKYKSIPGIIFQVSNILNERLLLSNLKKEKFQLERLETIQNTQVLPAFDQRATEHGQEILQKVDILNSLRIQEDEERVILASYCSFFNEYSQNYGLIQGGIIMDEYQPLI